jgi:hypothetical protein
MVEGSVPVHLSEQGCDRVLLTPVRPKGTPVTGIVSPSRKFFLRVNEGGLFVSVLLSKDGVCLTSLVRVAGRRTVLLFD